MPLNEFLAGLKLEVAFRRAGPGEASLVHDLVSRVGAFKLQAVERDESSWRDVLGGSELGVWLVDVTDRFGHHGASGLVALGRSGPHLVVDTLALSCRVLGKGVELRLLGMIAEHAADQGPSVVRIDYRRTAKNGLLGELLGERLSTFRIGDGQTFEVPCDELRRLARAVGPAPKARAAGVSFSLESFVRQRWRALDPEARAEALAGAAELASAAAIDSIVTERSSRDHAASSAPYVAPATALERVLTGIWCEVLGVPRVGMRDHFFHLGGHSLLVTQVLSRLRDTLQVELGLTDVFQAPTVAELVLVIERAAGPRERLERVAALVESVMSMSDDDVENVLSSRVQSPRQVERADFPPGGVAQILPKER